MSETLKQFNDYRQQMNEKILGADNIVLKRLFNLDTNTYAEGHLPVQTKEMLGLVIEFLKCHILSFIKCCKITAFLLK